MSDDLSNRGAQDRSRINIHEAHEMSYWTQRFEVSEMELRQAIEKVSVSAEAVGQHLGKS